MKSKTTLLFYRDFKGFTGGHLKVWEYYQHIQSSDQYKAKIFFTNDSSWINNPWIEIKNQCLKKWEPEKSDILFLAGMDWLALSEQQRRYPPSPVINLIQHVRHADPAHPLFKFLKYPATRICVSQQVADAIQATGRVNGSIFVNTNGIDQALLPDPLDIKYKDIPLLILGLKNPELALKLSEKLLNKGINNKYIVRHLPRNEFLSLVNRSHITVFLPTQTEGFYLPALEAMYLGTFVICPDCVGNQSFCLNKRTCLRPSYVFQDIMESIQSALKMDNNQRAKIISRAKKISLEHSIQRERKNFLQILRNVQDNG